MARWCSRVVFCLVAILATQGVAPVGQLGVGLSVASAAAKKKAKEKRAKSDKKDKKDPKKDTKAPADAVDMQPPPPKAASVGSALSNDAGGAPEESSSSQENAPKSSATDLAQFAGQGTAALLTRAKELYGMLEYADVIPLAEAVLAREDANIEQRLDAYLLQGSSLAIVGDSVEAEKPFRFLLRGRPAFEMPAETPPKILAVFRKVQVEEKAIANQLKDLARQNSVKSIELKSEVPAEGKGGVPLTFEYRLKDPRGAVATMNIHYRKSASEPYSSLALRVNDEGLWSADLPGEYTENEGGMSLQYYLTTQDIESIDLVTLGGPSSPLSIALAEGSVADAKPFYKSWWFWTATGVAVVAMGVGGWFGYDNYRQSKEPPSTSGRIDLKE